VDHFTTYDFVNIDPSVSPTASAFSSTDCGWPSPSLEQPLSLHESRPPYPRSASRDLLRQSLDHVQLSPYAPSLDEHALMCGSPLGNGFIPSDYSSPVDLPQTPEDLASAMTPPYSPGYHPSLSHHCSDPINIMPSNGNARGPTSCPDQYAAHSSVDSYGYGDGSDVSCTPPPQNHMFDLTDMVFDDALLGGMSPFHDVELGFGSEAYSPIPSYPRHMQYSGAGASW
jgi:hypothetical protein